MVPITLVTLESVYLWRVYICGECISVESVYLRRVYICRECISVESVYLQRVYICGECISVESVYHLHVPHGLVMLYHIVFKYWGEKRDIM